MEITKRSTHSRLWRRKSFNDSKYTKKSVRQRTVDGEAVSARRIVPFIFWF